VISTLNSTVVDSIGWYYVLIVTAFVVFGIVVAVSRMGSIKLGKDDDVPEYSVFSWFAMLFAAGMGIGLVFWGAAEPLTFFADTAGPGIPPNAAGMDDPTRAERALGQTFLHWGLRSEEHTSELQSRFDLVCRLLLEKQKNTLSKYHNSM